MGAHNNKVNICFAHSAIAIKQLTVAFKPSCFSPKCKPGIPTAFLSIAVWGYPDRTQSECPHSSKLTWFTSQTGLETNYHCTQQIATRRERQIDRLRRSNIHKVTRRNFCNCISEFEFASDQTKKWTKGNRKWTERKQEIVKQMDLYRCTWTQRLEWEELIHIREENVAETTSFHWKKETSIAVKYVTFRGWRKYH